MWFLNKNLRQKDKKKKKHMWPQRSVKLFIFTFISLYIDIVDPGDPIFRNAYINLQFICDSWLLYISCSHLCNLYTLKKININNKIHLNHNVLINWLLYYNLIISQLSSISDIFMKNNQNKVLFYDIYVKRRLNMSPNHNKNQKI